MCITNLRGAADAFVRDCTPRPSWKVWYTSTRRCVGFSSCTSTHKAGGAQVHRACTNFDKGCSHAPFLFRVRQQPHRQKYTPSWHSGCRGYWHGWWSVSREREHCTARRRPAGQHKALNMMQTSWKPIIPSSGWPCYAVAPLLRAIPAELSSGLSFLSCHGWPSSLLGVSATLPLGC